VAPEPLAPDAPLDTGGRAAEHRVQFVLSPRHEQILDDFCYHVRRSTRYKLTRSEVIRVLIEQLEHQALPVQQIRSLEDLRRHVQASAAGVSPPDSTIAEVAHAGQKHEASPAGRQRQKSLLA